MLLYHKEIRAKKQTLLVFTCDILNYILYLILYMYMPLASFQAITSNKSLLRP